jgi:heme peroxidase/type IX secretion system substrate protein
MKKLLQIKWSLKPALFLGLLTLSLTVSGQENRSIDGSGNNTQFPEWGAVGTNQLQIISNGFSDQVSEPGGTDRPNPRVISNTIFNQEGLIPDALLLSDYAWVWGQFIDHDITLVLDDASEPLDIPVPTGDPFFDPAGTGTMVIGMSRSAYDPLSGTDPSNPRAFPNGITSFVDASAVYGSDETKANWLRTFDSGKLKISTGNLLPYNTSTGELSDPVDPNAPEMAMPFPFNTKWFVAGDIRANENPLLTSMHTLFVREHNRLCDELTVENPAWTDEQLYQHSRKIVGGLMQAIIYEEWLPTLGVHLDSYSGYTSAVEPGIMNVFSAAAYRYGHTVINSTIVRMNNNGDIIPQGNILLRDAFFNPQVIVESGGIDPLLKGMATQVEQDFDCKMINDLRNFLFGAPGSGGLDLASMNINRGRERGLPDYNTVRVDIGLPEVESFATLTDNPWLNQIMESVYGDINNLDPWVGFLAEDHMSNALFGQSVMTIMERQFALLRDADRFYYENDEGLSLQEKEEIKATRFADVIMRNSNTTSLQDNVFLAELFTAVANVDTHIFEMEVYPNPTSSDLFINVTTMQTGEGILQVTDLLGHVIEQKVTNLVEGKNTFKYNLNSDLPDGLYNISLSIDGKIGHQKILKNGR